MDVELQRDLKQYALPNLIVQEVEESSILHLAAVAGDENRITSLLSKICPISKESKNGNTALHEAAWRGFSRSVKILCSVSQVNKKKTKTSSNDNKWSLQNNLLNIRNNKGFTALHLTAQAGHNQSCRELLLAGADPDIQNNFGDTALHTACRYGHAGVLRILLSSTCNPNIVNYNKDSPLHISCAMGRRKLTRILLNAGCNADLKNAQSETAYDIAMRKKFDEIQEILNNIHLHKTEKVKVKHKKVCTENVNWSPYGCHYYPDPQSFPSPKLETLPKGPLKKGEQYYIDLSGQIRKGPICVTNTCYCDSFFRNMEERIYCNEENVRMCVRKAKEKIGQRVETLAIRTNKQIEKLTKSMLEDRIRCENRRLELDKWIRSSKKEKNFNSIDYDDKQKISRHRSLDFLNDNIKNDGKADLSTLNDKLDKADFDFESSNPSLENPIRELNFVKSKLFTNDNHNINERNINTNHSYNNYLFHNASFTNGKNEKSEISSPETIDKTTNSIQNYNLNDRMYNLSLTNDRYDISSPETIGRINLLKNYQINERNNNASSYSYNNFLYHNDDFTNVKNDPKLEISSPETTEHINYRNYNTNYLYDNHLFHNNNFMNGENEISEISSPEIIDRLDTAI